MLFLVTWEISSDNRDEAQARFKETGGQPPEGAKMLQRWHSTTGDHGGLLAESSDAVALAKWTQEWSDLLQFDITPVLDDDQFAQMLGG